MTGAQKWGCDARPRLPAPPPRGFDTWLHAAATSGMLAAMIPKAALVMIVSLLLVVVPSGCDKDVALEVRTVYEDVDAATKSRDSATLLRLIDPKNIEAADRLMEMARTAPRETLIRLPAIDRLDIARMRNRLTREQLKSFDGRAWITHSCQQGWMAGNPGGAELSLGKVTYSAPRAYAKVLADGEETPIRLEFVKVDGQWLMDMDGMDEWLSQLLGRMADRAGVTEDVLLARLESAKSGKEVRQTIWDVPKL